MRIHKHHLCFLSFHFLFHLIFPDFFLICVNIYCLLYTSLSFFMLLFFLSNYFADNNFTSLFFFSKTHAPKGRKLIHCYHYWVVCFSNTSAQKTLNFEPEAESYDGSRFVTSLFCALWYFCSCSWISYKLCWAAVSRNLFPSTGVNRYLSSIVA